MDWADDVAYSVHDLEDGLHAGLVSLKNLKDYSERSVVSAVARAYYCGALPDVTTAELDTVFAEFMELDCWQFSFDGGPAVAGRRQEPHQRARRPVLPGGRGRHHAPPPGPPG